MLPQKPEKNDSANHAILFVPKHVGAWSKTACRRPSSKLSRPRSRRTLSGCAVVAGAGLSLTIVRHTTATFALCS